LFEEVSNSIHVREVREILEVVTRSLKKGRFQAAKKPWNATERDQNEDIRDQTSGIDSDRSEDLVDKYSGSRANTRSRSRSPWVFGPGNHNDTFGQMRWNDTFGRRSNGKVFGPFGSLKDPKNPDRMQYPLNFRGNPDLEKPVEKGDTDGNMLVQRGESQEELQDSEALEQENDVAPKDLFPSQHYHPRSIATVSMTTKATKNPPNPIQNQAGLGNGNQNHIGVQENITSGLYQQPLRRQLTFRRRHHSDASEPINDRSVHEGKGEEKLNSSDKKSNHTESEHIPEDELDGSESASQKKLSQGLSQESEKKLSQDSESPPGLPQDLIVDEVEDLIVLTDPFTNRDVLLLDARHCGRESGVDIPPGSVVIPLRMKEDVLVLMRELKGRTKTWVDLSQEQKNIPGMRECCEQYSTIFN
jgi:hypothetical protein